MKLTLARKNRGFAVVIALVAVVVLTIMAGAFAYSMKIETKLAATTDNGEQLIWIGRGGMDLACYVLSYEVNQPYNSLNQIWAGGQGSGPETNTPLMNLTPDHDPNLSHYPVGDGWVSIKITDLERKVNVNTAPAPLLQQVLTSMGVNADDISVVSDSIQDWIDPDDATRPAGAESDYYQSKDPPYYAKNAPIDDLAELLMIKGVTPKMYGLVDDQQNHDSTPLTHHKLGFGNAPGQEPDYPFYLKDIFTPYSSGKININTADANVLSLIPGMDTDSIQAILKWRAGPGGDETSSDATPFAGGVPNIGGVSPQAMQAIGTYCTTRSTTWEVHATAHYGTQTREFTGVVFTYPPNNAMLVRFYWDN